jgi:uncharacterized membrane protein YecN with MAPEG domain
MLLTTTLSMAAAAAIINFWLAQRIGRIRHAAKISVGDGGNELLARRMRAQLNFAENVPLLLVLIAAIELSGKGGAWLAPVSATIIIGRVLHGLGMDGKLGWARMVGTVVTMFALLGLAIVAALISLRII